MQQHVGITMAEQALFVRDIHPANNALAAFHQLVNVKTDTRTVNLIHNESFFLYHSKFNKRFPLGLYQDHQNQPFRLQ